MNGNSKSKRRKPRAIPEVLSESERAQVLAALRSSSILQRRNGLMVRVMLNLGLRSFEVCQIRVRHIDLDRGRLMVKNGKGGKDRIVGIPDDDLSLLRQFVSEKDLCPDALLFTTGTGKQIDTRFLRTMVLGIGQRAILNRRLKPHLLRHTMASRLYAATKDLDLVKRALGHCSITTTQIYVHQNPDNVIQAMKNLGS